MILDDGSTDDTLEVGQDLAGQDSSIEVHTQENRGRARTRSRLLDLAKTELVAWLDADNGDVLKARRFGGFLDDKVYDVKFAADGGLLLGGSFEGSIDFGCGPLEVDDGTSGFVAKLASP